MPRVRIKIEDIGNAPNLAKYESVELLHLICEVKNSQDLLNAIYKVIAKGFEECG